MALEEKNRKLMAMQNHNLWAPWRMQYIRTLEPALPPDDPAAPLSSTDPRRDSTPACTTVGDMDCFLCACARGRDDLLLRRERLLLHHDAQGMIVLNRYPYTSGHLLIAPLDHVSELEQLRPDQRAGMMELAVLAQKILRLAYNPQGFNLGINLGRCAGAGLPGHVHLHVVPRWNGDTNFTSVVAGVRVIPQGVEASYEELKSVLDAI